MGASAASSGERFAFRHPSLEQRRRLPECGIGARGGGEPLHAAEHIGQALEVGVKHRPAAVPGEAVPGHIRNIDVGGAERDAFLENARAFVHQRKDAAADDLALVDSARRDADFRAVRGNQRVDGRIGDGLVPLRAHRRLLAEAADLAETVGDP